MARLYNTLTCLSTTFTVEFWDSMESSEKSSGVLTTVGMKEARPLNVGVLTWLSFGEKIRC